MFELGDKVKYLPIPGEVFEIVNKCMGGSEGKSYDIANENFVIANALEKKLELCNPRKSITISKFKYESLNTEIKILREQREKETSEGLITIKNLYKELDNLRSKNELLEIQLISKVKTINNTLHELDGFVSRINSQDKILEIKNKKINDLENQNKDSTSLSNFFHTLYNTRNQEAIKLEQENEELLHESMNLSAEIGELKTKLKVITNQPTKTKWNLNSGGFNYIHELCTWVKENNISKENVVSIINRADKFTLFYWSN